MTPFTVSIIGIKKTMKCNSIEDYDLNKNRLNHNVVIAEKLCSVQNRTRSRSPHDGHVVVTSLWDF